MSHSGDLDFTKSVNEAARKLDVIAFDVERFDPELAAQLQSVYRDLEDANDTFVFGRPLKRVSA